MSYSIPAIIDTSSLLAITKYYLPFDTNGYLKKYLEQLVNNGNIIFLDRIHDECVTVNSGIILKELLFLDNKKLIESTKDIYPNVGFFSLMEDDFLDQVLVKNKGLSPIEIENEKKRFLNSGDGRIILYAYDKKNNDDDVLVISEESNKKNDNKVYRKIPFCCEKIDIKCYDFATYIKIRGENIIDIIKP